MTPWEVEVEDLIMSHGLPAVLRVVLDAVQHVAERHFWNNPESYRGNPVRAVIATEWKEEQ